MSIEQRPVFTTTEQTNKFLVSILVCVPVAFSYMQQTQVARTSKPGVCRATRFPRLQHSARSCPLGTTPARTTVNCEEARAGAGGMHVKRNAAHPYPYLLAVRKFTVAGTVSDADCVRDSHPLGRKRPRATSLTRRKLGARFCTSVARDENQRLTLCKADLVHRAGGEGP